MRDIRRGEDALRAYQQVPAERPIEEIVDEEGTEIKDTITDLLHLATHLDLNVVDIVYGSIRDWEIETVESIEDRLIALAGDITPEKIAGDHK